MEERNERKYEQIDRRREVRRRGLSIWHAVGGVALIGFAALVIISLPDINRYIKISRM
ncbi:MAG: hypothetical protein ABIO36_04515 [Pyrinomonadaceae bacterium]